MISLGSIKFKQFQPLTINLSYFNYGIAQIVFVVFIKTFCLKSKVYYSLSATAREKFRKDNIFYLEPIFSYLF